MTELGTLGCTINADYLGASELTCANSSNASWLVNGQYWWTRSAHAGVNLYVWHVNASGELYYNTYSHATTYGVRQVITINKADLS